MTNDAAFGKRAAVRVGTAGWAIPADARIEFPASGSLLQRYASVLDCVEINSSFYRPHRRSTYERWAKSVPPSFRFSLKMPKEITHVRRCSDCAAELEQFLDDTSALGEKRGALLIQFPPSFAYADATMRRFFALLRELYEGFAVCEPRHLTWFTPEVNALLRSYRIGRVAADPAIGDEPAEPGGWDGIAYYRLHGSPKTYYSRYGIDEINAFAKRLYDSSALERWCIFDNTGAGAALSNALEMRASDGFPGTHHFGMQAKDDSVGNH